MPASCCFCRDSTAEAVLLNMNILLIGCLLPVPTRSSLRWPPSPGFLANDCHVLFRRELKASLGKAIGNAMFAEAILPELGAAAPVVDIRRAFPLCQQGQVVKLLVHVQKPVELFVLPGCSFGVVQQLQVLLDVLLDVLHLRCNTCTYRKTRSVVSTGSKAPYCLGRSKQSKAMVQAHSTYSPYASALLSVDLHNCVSIPSANTTQHWTKLLTFQLLKSGSAGDDDKITLDHSYLHLL